jgi:hypothetical protein
MPTRPHRDHSTACFTKPGLGLVGGRRFDVCGTPVVEVGVLMLQDVAYARIEVVVGIGVGVEVLRRSILGEVAILFPNQ